MTENTIPETIFNNYLNIYVKDKEKKEMLKKLKKYFLYSDDSYHNYSEIGEDIFQIKHNINQFLDRDLKNFENLMKERKLSAFGLASNWFNNNEKEKIYFAKFVKKTGEIFDSFLDNIKTQEELEENKKFFTTIHKKGLIIDSYYNSIDERLTKISKNIISKQNEEKELTENNNQELKNEEKEPTENVIQEVKNKEKEPTENVIQEVKNEEKKLTENVIQEVKNKEKQSPTNIVLLIFAVILAVAGIVLGYLFIIYLAVCSVTVFWQISHEIKQTNSSLSLKIGRTILYFFAGPYNIVRYKRIYGTYNLFS